MKELPAFKQTFFDTQWYCFARSFWTADEAKSHWERLMKVTDAEAGRLEIAAYRILGPKTGEPDTVVVVGHKPDTLYEASEMIGGANTTEELDPAVYQALILRRIKFLVNAHEMQAPGGVYQTHGVTRLNDEGEVVG